MNRLEVEEKLWSYIDGQLGEPDKSAVDALVKTDLAWKDAYQELLSVQQLLRSSGLEEPSMRFTRNVMEEITRLHIAPATRTYINKNIVYGLGIFFGVMIAGLLIFMGVLISASPASPSAAVFDTRFDQFEWGKLFDSTYIKVFMMINTVLVLMLTDRYLTRKKKTATGQ